MPPPYRVEYRPQVLSDDIPGIPRNLQARILKAVEGRLMTEPGRYGLRLRRSLSGLWKLRVGDYRVVYELRDKVVTVWAIRHRGTVYGDVEKRLRRR